MISLDSPPDVRLVLTTEADGLTAGRLARTLLERRLVACATLLPVQSVYRWEGDIEESDEVQMLLKTDAASLDALCSAISELHSYEVPELFVMEAHAGGAYGDWLSAAVKPASPGTGPQSPGRAGTG